MNKQMNAAQVASYIKIMKMKIDSWKQEYQEAIDALAPNSGSYASNIDQRIKAMESALDEFMDVLNNG